MPPPVRPDPDHVPDEREVREDLAAAYRLIAHLRRKLDREQPGYRD